MKKSILIPAVLLALAILFLVFFFSPALMRSAKEPPFTVRVRIEHDDKELDLQAKGKCDIADAITGKVLKRELRLSKVTKISRGGYGIKIGDETFGFDRLRISPSGKSVLNLNGKEYRGEIDIIRGSSGLDAINRVELEDYLKGVLPREVNHLWPASVMKAQAIAARSFAVYQALSRKNKDYDLTADASSQVYGGKSGEKWRTTKAVEATRGKVLEYRGKVFPAYFHSCCGGHTEDISRLWHAEMAPLKGVRCNWCRWSPYFRWMVRMPTQTILKKLKNDGYDIKRIDNIKAGKRDESGRLEYISVKSGRKWLEIKTDSFRSALGKRKLKSANFRMKKYPFFYLFSGHGWGHGIGMCQWGAFGLSLRGWSPERILRYYYPGTKVVRLRQVLK
jgi:stage II sporulation protein D